MSREVYVARAHSRGGMTQARRREAARATRAALAKSGLPPERQFPLTGRGLERAEAYAEKMRAALADLPEELTQVVTVGRRTWI